MRVDLKISRKLLTGRTRKMRGVRETKYEVDQKDVKYENTLSEEREIHGSTSQIFGHSQGSQQDQKRYDHCVLCVLIVFVATRSRAMFYMHRVA